MISRSSMLVPIMKEAWRKSGVALRSGATDADIEAFEHLHGARLGEDIAEYFRSIDGMNESEADEHSIRFWPLAEVRPVLQEIASAKAEMFGGYFVFADYSLWAHGYAVRVAEGTDDVILVGDEKPIAIAASFADFLEIYTSHPEKLFPRRIQS